MLVLLFLLGSCARIGANTFELNNSPEKNIDFSPTYIKNNLHGNMFVEPSQVNDGSLYIGTQNNVGRLATNVNNNLPGKWVQSPEVNDNLLYMGGHKSIELSANIKSYLQPPETNVPFYVNSLKEIELAVIHLNDNLLSMAGAMPYLLDPRRDFAEIIKVIYGISSEIGHSCGPFNYEKTYQKLINKFAPDGIKEPQVVIHDIQLGLAKYNHLTNSLQKLIRSKCHDQSKPRHCDYDIHNIVISQPERYQAAAKVFFAVNKAAHEFNNRIKKLKAICNCHKAHKFIIEAPEELKPVVYELANVIRVTKPLRNSC